MNRADYLVKPCPGWCVAEHVPDRIMDDIKIHESASVTVKPALCESPTGAGTVEVCLSSHETLGDDGPESSPTFILLYATDSELSAAEARKVAAVLLDHADLLDQITAN